MISRVMTKIVIQIFKKLEQKNNVLINPKQDQSGQVKGYGGEETNTTDGQGSRPDPATPLHDRQVHQTLTERQ